MRWLFAAVLSSSVIAQTLTPVETAELARAARNPFELGRFIDSHPAGSWEIEWKPPSLKVIPTSSAKRGGFCGAEIVNVMVPEQAIVIVQCESWSTPDQYIRYTKRSDGRWLCEGSREYFPHGWRTRHEIYRGDREPYLRVSHQGDYGTGLYVELNAWFDLTSPGFDPVFDFPVQGNNNQPYQIGTEFTADIDLSDGEIKVDLTVKFETDISEEKVSTLGERDLSATYKRKGNEFRCASVTDGASCADFKALSTAGGPAEEDLVRLSLRVLKDVATGSNDDQKRWLRGYLAQRKNTPEVRELRALLK